MTNTKKQEYCLVCRRLLDNPEADLGRKLQLHRFS